ncbi:aspartate--tRNA ligase [Dialister pneumosintes]|jgi:aspartyl-tRNA synthetase, bacterial type|uniref:Aspartate--tRNA(Asp/Asn) ligase n=1 Tax=Dialister pneumosintes TaxID=39950 RepID=A0A1B3WDI1_9FIRM|nr:aspartate--tRNA ligase [Dialister pneumosintes]AOH39026.1 aspartate--tRNA ligase [Dialister pneumosintes]RID94004.1 aspartate--tRNA ligase [Dialister pneumosintes]
MENMVGMHRTCGCGDVREHHSGKQLTLAGWVQRRRDHGGLIFVDLRDRSGVVQLVFSPQYGELAFHKAEDIRNEYVVAIIGQVRERSEDTVNSNMPTGKIEVVVTEMRILNKAKTPPFYIEDDISVDENVRLKHRYLDLRRPEMQRNLIMRHKIIHEMRSFLNELDFLEIETPMLTKSTPEGARDYLVPSRVNAGKFYALPQSPQIFKQLLMVSGFERYFQVARCFRDEDLRADRQPEFTQLDMEVSFEDQDFILNLVENMMQRVFKNVLDMDIPTPFKRITWDDAMNLYGSDKPDLRFDMHFYEISDLLRDTEFKVFRNVLDNGGQVKAITVKGNAGIPRRELDDLVDYVGQYGAKGLAWIGFNEDGTLKCQITKFLGEEKVREIGKICEAEKGDLVLIIADKPKVVAQALGELRLEMARRMNLINPNEFCFRWVVDFPMFEYNEEEKRYVAMHHPFTAPRDEDVEHLLTNPGNVYAKAYDLVINGVEAGGGSLRIYQEDLQEKVFQAIGISREEAEEKFGFLLKAFQYGAPPHEGIAFGLDRLVMLMLHRASIRDVIAFPKTQSAVDQMAEAPNVVTEKQLGELHIKLDLDEDKEKELF